MTLQNTSIERQNQSLSPGNRIEMYSLDLNPIGQNQVWHFSPHGNITFQGILYVAFDVQTEGFEWNGQGGLPQPKIRISNTQRTFAGISAQFQDLVGARLTRMRTYRQFLDGEPGADPNAYFSPDIYVIEQKTAHNNKMIEWSMTASIDQQGRKVPGRQVLRDLCLWRYRAWNATTSTFNYTHAQCPYTGAASFDSNGNRTTSDKDDCGRRISDCKVRFGGAAPLPYGGFPGVARVHA